MVATALERAQGLVRVQALVQVQGLDQARAQGPGRVREPACPREQARVAGGAVVREVEVRAAAMGRVQPLPMALPAQAEWYKAPEAVRQKERCRVAGAAPPRGFAGAVRHAEDRVRWRSKPA